MYFSENSFEEIKNLNDGHLNYLRSKRNVVYGGISKDERDQYDNILYIISCENYKEAESFAKSDPYFEIISQYKIENFIQKIPKT